MKNCKIGPKSKTDWMIKYFKICRFFICPTAFLCVMGLFYAADIALKIRLTRITLRPKVMAGAAECKLSQFDFP